MGEEDKSMIDPSFEDDLRSLGLTEAELDAILGDPAEMAGLGALLEPPPDMVERVTNNVERRLADREAMAAIIDLGGLGWFTIRALLKENKAK